MKTMKQGAARLMLLVAAFLSGTCVFGGTKMMTLTVAADAVTETQADLPVLVRLSTAISGFSYADFALPNGGDLQFTDEAGNVLPHEVDTWNESGESLVWVKLPTCANGTSFKCFFGSGNPSSASSTDVWSDYFSVLHANGADNTTLADSSGSGRVGEPAGDENRALATTGPLGAARVTGVSSSTKASFTNSLQIAGSASIATNQYAISFWFNANLCTENSWGGYYPSLAQRLAASGSGNAWIFSSQASDSGFRFTSGSSYNGYSFAPTLRKRGWSYLTMVLDGAGKSESLYTNGASFVSSTVPPKQLNFSAAAGTIVLFNKLGTSFDEVRVSSGVPSAARVAADYATQTRTDFLTAGAVTDATLPVFDDPVFGVTAEGKMSASVNVTEGSGTLVFEYANGANVTRVAKGAVTAPATVIDVPTLAADAIYTVTAEITSSAGVVVRQASAGSFLNGEVSVAKTTDATHPDAGAFTVTRPDSAEAKSVDLTLGYTVASALTTDIDYAALSGAVTIPAGANTATVTVTPLDNHTAPRSGELKLTLAGGSFLPSVNTSAVMTVTTAKLPMPQDGGTVTLDGVQYAEAVTYRPTGTGYTVVLTNNAVLNTNVKNGSGFGMTASDSATIVVTDNSVVSNTDHVTIFNTTTHDSTFLVSDGGNLIWGRNQGNLQLFGERNTLVVTNAFLEMPRLSGTDRAHVKIYGAGNSYFEVGDETIVNYAGLGLLGIDGLVEISGGKNVNGDYNTNALNLDGTNNVYRQKGGTYRDWLRLQFSATGVSNTVEVCEGATNDIDRMDTDYLAGTANKIVIDDARLEMGRDNVLSLFGTAGAAKNFSVELKGVKPELAFMGQAAIGTVDAERIHFVFTPPADGWTEAPVTCGKDCLTNHYDIAVNISAFPEGVKRIPLVTFGKATELDVASIPVTSAPLKYCLLVYEGKTLYLRPPKKGLSVIIR